MQIVTDSKDLYRDLWADDAAIDPEQHGGPRGQGLDLRQVRQTIQEQVSNSLTL